MSPRAIDLNFCLCSGRSGRGPTRASGMAAAGEFAELHTRVLQRRGAELCASPGGHCGGGSASSNNARFGADHLAVVKQLARRQKTQWAGQDASPLLQPQWRQQGKPRSSELTQKRFPGDNELCVLETCKWTRWSRDFDLLHNETNAAKAAVRSHCLRCVWVKHTTTGAPQLHV